MMVLTDVFICADLHLVGGTENVRASKGATMHHRGTCINGIVSVCAYSLSV